MLVLKGYRYHTGYLWWHNFFFNTNILCVYREQTMKIRGGYTRLLKTRHDQITTASQPWVGVRQPFTNVPWLQDKRLLASHSRLWPSMERLRTVLECVKAAGLRVKTVSETSLNRLLTCLAGAGPPQILWQPAAILRQPASKANTFLARPVAVVSSLVPFVPQSRPSRDEQARLCAGQKEPALIFASTQKFRAGGKPPGARSRSFTPAVMVRLLSWWYTDRPTVCNRL